MEPWRPPSPRRYYPGRTLRTLHLAATARFQSGIVLIRRPLLAHAASDQVRALIELFAHAAWINGAGGLRPPMTPRARAICVELGMARALVDELEFLESIVRIPFPAGYIADKRLLVRHFTRLHATHACVCHGAGRKFSAVRGTLRALDAVETDERLALSKMFYGLWVTFSRAVHFPRLEHIAADAPGGAALRPMSIRDRAFMLHNLVMVESHIAELAATPFPSKRRQIGLSAHLLLFDVEAQTHRPGERALGTQ